MVAKSTYDSPEAMVLELIAESSFLSLSGQWEDPGTDPRFPGGDE